MPCLRDTEFAPIFQLRYALPGEWRDYGGMMIAAPARSIQIPNLFDLPANLDDLKWETFRAGIKIHRIYGNQNEGPSAALLLYEPGTVLPRHTHQGYEHIFVLSNSQRDENGEHRAGTLVINPPGSSHKVHVPATCLVLAIWEKPVIFDEPA